MSSARRLLALCGCALLIAACADDDPPEPFSAEVVVEGLVGPTQLAITDDAWFVAHLNGAEGDGRGQVLRIDPTDPGAVPTVIVEDLDKPTGVAVFDGDLWIMETRRLTRGPLDGARRTIVVDQMAFNGRSEGTLTVDGERLLFDTSGTGRVPTGPDGTPVDTSGALWSVDAEGTIENLAWGFKHAYAHVRDGDGALWSVEMSDGAFDGLPARDEVVAVTEGTNHGWPTCVGDNRAVASADIAAPCDGVPASLVTFDPGATPTGLAVAPWDRDRLIVALWVERRVVEIDIATGSTATVTEALSRPQHLVADGDRLLATDHEAGTIVEIRRN
ncbi:MAG: PQQ-dependent sugar dehydrogenase [Actinomycetota bacterium]